MKLTRFCSFYTAAVIAGFALVAGVERVMAARPIGIDISDYQSPGVDWSVLKNTYGVTFGWAKISQGQRSSGGANFAGYAASAKAAGVPIGAYHYSEINVDTGTAGATAEANYFSTRAASYLVPGGYYLMPMLDVEGASLTGTKTSLSIWVNQWCTTVSNNSAALGNRVKPCLYTSTSSSANWFDSTLTIWTPDLAAWPYAHASAAASAQTGAPATSPWSTWTFWQYDDQNVAQAYTTGDGDIFNGTYAQLTNTYLITSLGPPGPTLTSQPASVTATPGTNVAFVVGATGGGTLNYQWKFNGTNIAGSTLSYVIVTNVDSYDAGNYTVAVSDNSNISLVSTSAFLSVVSPLTNGPVKVVAPTNVVNWWPADGNGNDIFGTLNGSPVGGFNYAPGLRGLAYHFDGATSYITNVGATDLPVPWTASVWVNREDAPGTAASLFQNGTNAIKLEQYNGTRNVGISVLGVVDSVFSPAYSVPTNVWTHLVFVGTASGVTLYVNGVSTSSATNVIPFPRATIGANWIVTGTHRYVDYMKGSVDEVMTFSRALTATEIASIYSAGNSGLVRTGEITGAKRGGFSKYTLNFMGVPGKSYTLYSSTDLATWSPVSTVTTPKGTNVYNDNLVSINPLMFYRLGP